MLDVKIVMGKTPPMIFISGVFRIAERWADAADTTKYIPEGFAVIQAGLPWPVGR
jgi:hypothetical protein